MPSRSAPPEIEAAPAPDASSPARESGALGSPRNTVIVIVPILLVLITFLFWYQTWFGRGLSDQEMAQDLADTSVPHKTQHALAQLSDRIARGDPTVKRWYPQLLALAQNKESQMRLEAAWAMGQDNHSEEFHQALRKLIDDPVPMVRWNAALALVRFGDGAAEPQLRSMLQPFTLGAPEPGTIRFRMKEQDDVRNGSIIARIRLAESDPQRDVVSPVGGTIARLLTKDGATVAAGERWRSSIRTKAKWWSPCARSIWWANRRTSTTWSASSAGRPICRNECASKRKLPPAPSGNGRRKGKAEVACQGLDRKLDSEMRLDFFRRYHLDGIPRAAVQKAAVRTFAGTLFAADAECRVDFDPAERGMVLVGDPVHAVGHGAIRNAGRRAGATRAAFGDDREFLGPLLARSFNANGFGLALDDFPNGNVILGQVGPPRPECKDILPEGGGNVNYQNRIIWPSGHRAIGDIVDQWLEVSC